MSPHPINPARPKGAEKLLGLGLLLALVVVGLGVFFSQFDYNPAVESWRQLKKGPAGPAPAANASAASDAGAALAALAPASLTSAGPVQSFGPDDLYVKINGKADLYLTSGFVSLASQRFALQNDPEAWLELYAYDMGDPKGAFSVFSQQRRPGGQPLADAPLAYVTANAVYAAQGRYYLEVMGSAGNPALLTAARELALNFLASRRDRAEALREASWFPRQGMLSESLALAREGAFGFAGFKDLFLARYQTKDGEAVAFISLLPSPAAAQKLAGDYLGFIIANGGKEMTPPPAAPPGARLAEFIGSYELVFSQGPLLAGVHEAPTAAAASELAGGLAGALREVKP